MTYRDIKRKFMIEYDKENITSSYPSLTTYEIATMLDKAYLALISQKATGNFPRRVPFEGDNKQIQDLQPLITTKTLQIQQKSYIAENDVVYNIPQDFMYYVDSKQHVQYLAQGFIGKDALVEANLVTHEVADKYMYTTHNRPWIEIPVCYIENNHIVVLIDLDLHSPKDMLLTYIREPQKFVDHISEDNKDFDNTVFELSDNMAEELINLAIVFSAETVESQRSTTKSNLIPLES